MAIRSCWKHCLSLLLVLLQIVFISGSGIFELRLLAYHSDHGKDLSGLCCSGSSAADNSMCSGNCATFFRICLKEYQNSIDPEPPCTYGSRMTEVLGGNSVDFTKHEDFQEPMQFPFSFAWPGTFSLIVEAWHNSTAVDTVAAVKRLLLRLAERKNVQVDSDWTTEEHSSANNRLKLQYRVKCDDFYYGTQCMDYCRPKNGQYGHYTCSKSGKKRCLDGWQGQFCDKPVCLPGCHPQNGHCEVPNECKCRMGFIGELCDQCQRYPGCQHGSCQKPFDCTCDEGWGGLFCNQDLNYCTHHKPCLNGATCTNTGAGHYTCTCQPGFTGTNCEIKIEDCTQSPCMNGGTCKELASNYSCQCPEGFSGRHCQISARSCAESPCENGASCLDTERGYTCVCVAGFEGTNCDIERDECRSAPCQNGGRCVDQFDGYKCVCPMGFTGDECEENINDCTDNTCLNGGTCVDDINYFKCECPPGYSGTLCQYNVDDCIKRPCANGGTCFDLTDDFRCMCRPGFKGKDCSIDINECESNPCRNGARCEDMVDDYKCHCASPCFTGQNCNVRQDDCLFASTFGPQIGLHHDLTTPVAPAGEAQASQSRLEKTLLMVIIPVIVLFGLVVIGLVIGFLCLCRRYRKGQFADAESRQNRTNQRLAAVCAPERINNKLVSSYPTAIVGPFTNVQPKPAADKNQERYACIKAKNLDQQPVSPALCFSFDEMNTFSAKPISKAISVEKLHYQKRQRSMQGPNRGRGFEGRGCISPQPQSPSMPLPSPPPLKTEFSKDSGLGSPQIEQMGPLSLRKLPGDSFALGQVGFDPEPGLDSVRSASALAYDCSNSMFDDSSLESPVRRDLSGCSGSRDSGLLPSGPCSPQHSSSGKSLASTRTLPNHQQQRQLHSHPPSRRRPVEDSTKHSTNIATQV